MSCQLFLFCFLSFVLIHSSSAANETTVASSLKDWKSGSSCSFKLLYCDPVSVCEDRTVGNTTYFRCYCPLGYEGDGYINGTMCTLNVTQCMKKSDCHQFGICNQTVGYCQCAPGFVGDGAKQCDDIDECLTAPCDPHATCANNPGSFTCTCKYFLQYFGDGFTCEHQCQGNHHCHPNAICVRKTSHCVCKNGFLGDGINCTDIDECLDNSTCGTTGVTCVNLVGGYRCDCNNGYFRMSSSSPCQAAPRDCEEIRLTLSGERDGQYLIDPDFTGPASLTSVWCDFREGYAITMLNILNKDFMELATGDQYMDYGADDVTLRALLNASYFCSQETKITCRPGFFYDKDFMWLDAFNVSHTTWAGASEEGLCGCGQLGKCERCYCHDNEVRKTDVGLFVDKSRLPVTFVSLPTSSRNHRYSIGPLRCGPRVFDIAADCHQWKLSNRRLASRPFHIDVDGPFGRPPFLVYCDLHTYPHVGVTEVQLTRTEVTSLNHEQIALDYQQEMDDVTGLVNMSAFCIQDVSYICQNSSISGMKAFVTVTAARRNLTHFPGADPDIGGCPCGSTKSCEDPALRCNCDIEDDRLRQDRGSIINRDNLPVVAVTGNGGEGRFSHFTLSHLQCAPLQFGIESNCEKLRSKTGFDPYNYTYYIDPDGFSLDNDEQGNVAPFLVECAFSSSPVHGITIIHHSNESTLSLMANFSLYYLEASRLQIEALKHRSTYCTQEVQIDCRRFSLAYNGGGGQWSGLDGQWFFFHETLTSCLTDQCQCQGGAEESRDAGVLDSVALPVTGVDFSAVIEQLSQVLNASANITIGPLKCAELFKTCAKLQAFVEERAALGETLPEKEATIAIDPDGSGPVAAFEVTCSWPDTVIKPAVTEGNLTNKDGNPKTQCFDIVYKDSLGKIITPEQILALRNMSPNCFQSLKVTCQYARVYGAVNYTTCDGVTQTGWAGSLGQDSCACGVAGHCQGGPGFKCNCDLEDGEIRSDGAVIIRHDRLPVCQVCLSLAAVLPNETATIPYRRLIFSVSNMHCHPGRGRHVRTSCQNVRRSTRGIRKEQTEIVYMGTNDKNYIPVGCKLVRYPPLGQLVIFPQKQVHPVPVNETVHIVIRYYTVNMTILHEQMQQNVYCSQKVYFFCVPPFENITIGGGNGWVDVKGNFQQFWDVVMEEEISRTEVCQDYAEHCARCGPPAGFVVYQKELLPITGIHFNITGGVTVVVESVKCTDVFQNCYEILQNQPWRRIRSSNYAIDPDGAGGVEPFTVFCDFHRQSRCAVSRALVYRLFARGVRIIKAWKPGQKKRQVSYSRLTAQQIASLTRVSEFCWQPVQFQCKLTKLINDGSPAYSYYSSLTNPVSLSFGTGNRTDVTGCACSLTGTCEDSHTCHCDAASSEESRDAGVVSKKETLPIVRMAVGGQASPEAYGVMSVGNVFCSNTVCQQFPRDCQEALEWREMNGINYEKSGEYFINPLPDVCEPFLVYCQMDLQNQTGTTRIVSRTREDTQVTPGKTSRHDYFVPTLQHIRCLVEVSQYCIQPVAYECYRAKLLGGGAAWSGPGGQSARVWGGGSAETGTCACGKEQSCGGLDSSIQQLNRKCNCDAMDNYWRRDAGVLNDTSQLPLISLNLTALDSDPESHVNVTIGDLFCGQKPIEFDECSTGFHDCAERARCVDTATGYTCICPVGWEGKTMARLTDNTLPVANGRQCIDDDECSFNVCPLFKSTCTNTPGSYFCTCNPGYIQTGPASCEDIDECANGTHDCDVNARCVNEMGQYKCVCKRNYRGNGFSGNCHRVGICNVFGDPHIQRYDRRWLDYMGNPDCRYVVTTNECQEGTEGDFRVLMKPWKQSPPKDSNSHVTWVQNIEVHLKGRVIELLQDRVTIVDGVQTFGFTSPELVLFDNGRQMVLVSDDGIEIYWDGIDQLIVIIPMNYTGELCGICGALEGDPTDLWKTGPACSASGSLTDNYQIFGNSWVDPQSVANNSKCAADCNQPPPNETCLVLPAVSEFYCDKVYDVHKSPLADCLREIDQDRLAGLSRSCEFDMCHVKNDITDIMCTHAQAVVEECQITTGVTVTEWRTPDFCGMNCTGNTTYLTCGPDPASPNQPQLSCMDIRASPDRLAPALSGCVEGCFCKPGFVQEGSRCISAEDCGCIHNGSYVPLGSTMTSHDCQATVTCTRNGVMQPTDLQCGQDASCGLKNSIIGCHCHDGFLGDGFTCTPDPCANVTCPDLTQCVEGECQCLPGYIGNCETCEDIDECASRTHDCTREGEFCVNTNGSFTCECDTGYINIGDRCEDVDECAMGLANCPAHSECLNRPGMYVCVCCVGYTLSSNGECLLLKASETQYIDPSVPDTPCCSCDTEACRTSGRVCGSDGETYPSLRALIVEACQKRNNVEPMYKGTCRKSCKNVRCLRPYAECVMIGDTPTCVCQPCRITTTIEITESVCASDLRIYRTKCEFETLACVTYNTEIVILTDPTPCPGSGGPGAGPSTGWSSCSAMCSEGTVYRTVTSASPPYEQYNITAICFGSCPVKETCEENVCSLKAQDCFTTDEGPLCMCPKCDYIDVHPVCGQMADEISTFDNLCSLRAKACVENVDYFLLDDKECEAVPTTCDVTEDFYRRIDEDGCYNQVPHDYGRCAGGCGKLPDECCYKSNVTMQRIPFECPGGVVVGREVEVITGCHCVTPEELTILKAQNGE